MKQATLLKAWHPKGSAASGVPKPKDKPPDDMVELSDEDDEFLVQAMDETLAGNSTSAFRDGSCSMQKPLEQLEGFDVVAGQTWVYPTNYPVRSYQFNIVQSALFKNTMVILPTGLGKTFIAAVVMYNFYRWYPTGKIVFMAPTRPLVAQQIEACYNIMGIPLEDTMEMTGTVPAGQRAEGWRQRRVFFLTPQVMMNDLLRNALRPHDVRCLVIDEAHKALGSYSYCQVVKEIIKDNNQFRILALSATPGTDVKAVRNVLANLMISHVELRTEDSLDIQAFTQKRTIEKVVVPLGEEIGELKNKFLGVIRMYLDRLDRAGAIPRVNPESLGKYRMLLLKEGFQQNPPSCLSSREVGQLQGYFSLLISLYHAYELLLAHGMQPFFFFLKGIVDGEKSQPRVRYELMHNGDFEDLYKHLEQRLGVSEASANDTLHPTAAAAASSLYENTLSDAASRAAHIVGHPKLAKLEEIILEHFRNFAGNEGGTRVMVFSQYRDSVKEITAQLNRHQPLVKAMNFVGQRAGTAKGFSQKEQLLVVKKFREGGYNVLVSTCVGEEGLDIGEIDLIVCFDAPKSPIRLVQRMGRTGRKREGRIVVLLTEGKEEQAYKESNYKKQNIHRAITSGRQLGNLYEASPRMVPRGINPVCHRMHMTVPEYRSAKNAATSGRGARSILNFITGKQQKKSSAALNKQEELYYEAHYEVAPSTVPLLPPAPARFLSLQKFQAKHKKTETVNDCNRPRLSLSSWTPWQCEEQRTQYVAHSSKTKLYVEVMRFIENTRLADEELDAYSLELKPFLQMEYVLSSDECLSPDPNLVGAGSKDSSTGKKGPRKKLTKKADRWVVADDVKSKEETDEKDCKGPNNVALSVVKQERPEDADKVVKKKKKRRVITDFFQDKSQSHDSSSCISFETDLCERVEEMDCQKDVEADEECVVLVSSGTHDVDMEDRGNADAADSREEELEPDPVEVEIQTPPRLDVDVFPSPGHTLPPVDVAKVVFGHGQATDDKTANKLVIDVTHDSMDSRGCGVGTPDMECQKSGTRTRSCKMKFSKLEVDSDIEDFLDDECFKDEKGLSGDDHSIHEQPSSTTEKALLEVDKVHSKVAEKQTEAPSQAAVEAWDLIGDVNMDSFCNELFNSDADMLGDNVCSKVDDKKKPVPKSPVISTRGPTLLSELGIHSEDLFDTKWDQTADNTDALKPGDKGAKASSPIIIASQRLAPPSHSTPSRTVPTGSFVNAAVSPRDLDNGPGGICVPSPIRRAVPECMENSDWNLHSDSDMELFENASDGRISDQSINSGGEEGCDDMGITELCNFIEENSVVEEARDNPVSRRSLLAQKLSGSPTENVETIKLIVSCNGSQETASSSVNLNDRSTIGNKQSSGGKSLSIKQLSNSCRRDLKAEKSFKESSSRSMEVESKSIAKVAKDPPSLHMSSVRDQSTAAKSLSAIQQDPDQNQSSASKRPSFEITVDWSDFDSGSGSDEPVATAKPSTQLQKGRASLSSTFGAGGMTQSRNVPVAMVKPIMCSTATKTVDVISSGDDSPVQVRRRPCQKRILSQSSTESESSPIAMRRPSARCLDDSDEDFQALTCRKQPQTQKRRLQKVINKKVPKNGAATRKKPQQSSRKKSNFIEHEADVSADIVNSSDESENSSLDHLDESFIDDQTQVPNKTLYLQTVRSPVNPAKFKIGHSNHVRYSEVFSQAVSQDEADYERDSFCVGSDDSSALHRLSSSASDQLEEQESPVRSRVKTRQRKRRIRISSTSEEESCRTKYISKSQKIDVDDSPVSRKHQGEELAKPASKVFRCVGAAIEVSGCALASLPGNITSALTPGSETSRVLSREERLRLQKIRQEEFRRTHMASLHNKRSLSADVCQSPIEAQAQIDETITIIVDTREIASGTALVSALRAFKGIQVEVFSLAAGSLVVGRRCCILRKALADFGNPQNNSRLVAEVRHLFELYDRPCLILERPQRVKPGERPFKRTKYFDNMLMFLNSTHAKVFFSDSQANTAEVVVALAKKESQKGMALPSPKCLQSKNPAVQFYLAFPKVSLATAISLTTAYPSVRSLVKSSVEELQERIKISESRAKDILDFCKASAIV